MRKESCHSPLTGKQKNFANCLEILSDDNNRNTRANQVRPERKETNQKYYMKQYITYNLLGKYNKVKNILNLKRMF